MEAIRLHTTIEKDGEIVVTGLPCQKGQTVEMIVLLEPLVIENQSASTASRLLRSELIGLWEDRQDITDSATYARHLREQAQRRQG